MRYPAYPKYKESGVQWLGQVPGHWEVKRGRFTMRVNPPAPLLRNLEDDQDVSFVPMDAVNEYGGIRLDQTRVKAEVGGGYTEFQDGDVVIAKITPCFENGKGSIATGLVNSAAYGTTELHVLRASQILDSRFLFYLTITDGYRKLGESEMYGAGGQKRVPPEFCKDFLTPLPPLPEQTAIADFLDRETGRIDRLTAKKRRLIALLAEKRSALISRTVTRGLPEPAAREFGLEPHTRFKDSGIEWLGQVPEGWETPPLYSRYSIELGKMLNESRITGEHLVRYLRNVDVQWDLINYEDLPEMDIPGAEHSRYTIQTGDLLVCEGGEVGRAAIVGRLSSTTGFQKALHRMRARKPTENPRYMYYILYWASNVGVFSAGGISTIAHLTGEQLRKYRFPAPPLPEQTAIATYLDRETATIDRLVEKVEAAIARLQEYRTALITAAVTGKIDVREAVDGVDRVDKVILEAGCGG